ncbi:MAG: WYL domain-containing protein [Thermotaleaceae bacterium]
MSPRKYDEDLRRMREFIDASYILESFDLKKKYVRLHYNYYQHVENYLLDSYLCKSFTNLNLSLFILIQQILKEKNRPVEFTEIRDELELLMDSEHELDSSIIRQLNELVEWGMIEKDFSLKKIYYSVQRDFFEGLENKELIDLYNTLQFFSNITFPSVPGYYLKKTLERYLRYHRDIEVKNHNPFLYRFNHFHSVLEEEILWPLLWAIHYGREVKINHFLKGKKTLKNTALKPIKVLFDVQYGRWFLIGKSEFHRLSVYRVEDIKKVNVLLNKAFPIESYRQQYQDEYEKSWMIVGKKEDLEWIKLRFSVDKDADRNFLIDRVKREGRHGEIQIIDERSFIYTIAVNDLNEIKPWIRSFHHRVEILSCSKDELKEDLNKEWKELLNQYESIRQT